MSQSNKKGNVIFIIIIIIIIVISGLVTYYAIINHNKNTNDISFNSMEFAKVSHKDTVDVFKNYPVNPILFDEEKLTISGLKNKKVENIINDKLKKLVKDSENNNKWCSVGFNNSNVLSVECNLKSLTVDLNTGENILLEDIFNDGTDLYSIITEAIYDSACNYMFDCYSTSSEYDNQIDNYIIDTFKKIKDRNYDLYINSNYINISNYNDWEEIVIGFSDYQNDVTIYNRYLNANNIYEKDIEEYCDVYSCFYKNIRSNTNDLIFKKFFYNNSTYIDYYFSNITNCDITNCINYTDSKEIIESNVSENILNEIIRINNLDEKNTNYRFIAIDAYIYKKSYGYNQIYYTVRINEYDNNNFQKRLIGDYNSKTINDSNILRTDMVLVDNKLNYLKANPKEIFNNFEEELSTYIQDNLKDDNDYNNPIYAIFYARMEPLEVTTKNIQKVIKEANYSIDYDNKIIIMVYDFNLIKLPWELFSVKNT